MTSAKVELNSIKHRSIIFRKCIDNQGTSIIGINENDTDIILDELLKSLIHYKKNCNVLIVSDFLTPLQLVYKVHSSLPLRSATFEMNNEYNIVSIDNNLTISIGGTKIKSINEKTFDKYDHIIVLFNKRNDIKREQMIRWSKQNGNSRLIVTVECPKGKEIGYFRLRFIKKYIDNIIFMMYSQEDGNVCFVDRFKGTDTLYYIK